jgi:hypothetical protein
MELYTQPFTLPNVLWAEPMGTTWQWLTTGPGGPGSKIPHLSIAESRTTLGSHHLDVGSVSDIASHHLRSGRASCTRSGEEWDRISERAGYEKQMEISSNLTGNRTDVMIGKPRSTIPTWRI